MPDERVPWPTAEPTRYSAELEAMAQVAPGLAWNEVALAWTGELPPWPFARPAPPTLEQFLAGRRFLARVQYSQGFPMVAPRIVPVDPQPDPIVRTRHDWHVNGDGTLCLFRQASDWDGDGTAAELVVKAAGWFLEYLLMEAGRIEEMTEAGVVNDDRLDHLLTPPEDG